MKNGAGYNDLIEKYEEYIKFLGKDSLFAALHGMCSADNIKKGERLRAEIAELKGSL